MQVNAVLSATANGKKINTTISHLRESQEDKAALLAQTLNAFTTNIYSATQVNEIGITEFTPAKSVPTLEFNTSAQTVEYSGDGILSFAAKSTTTGGSMDTWGSCPVVYTPATAKVTVYYGSNHDNAMTNYDLLITASETNNFAGISRQYRR